MNLSSAARPHRRFNALRGEWVLVSPQRTQRPWQGQTTKPVAPAAIAYDPACYLCPGNPRAGGAQTPEYTGVYVFDNDYPALLAPEPGAADATVATGSLLISEPESGRCRVVCFDPNHSLTLAGMPVDSIVRVVETWAEETATLGADPKINYVTIFENRGAMMGSSNPHPHGQIWATEHIPNEAAAESGQQLAYYLEHGTTLLSAYLAQELAVAEEDGSRVVCENPEFVALVPYWAVWPFETLILPRSDAGSFTDLTAAQTRGLADLLSRLTRIYDKLFDVSFPYTMGFHQRPTDTQAHPEWTFHGHFYPPLLRSAEIRKFMVGFEMLGMPQRDITPEKAAEMLRAAKSRIEPAGETA